MRINSHHLDRLSELILARAIDSRDRVFCSLGGKDLTFGAFATAVKEYAGALAEAGVSSGDRVGLMLGQTQEHIVLFYAISWLGALPVPFSIHLKSAGLEVQMRSAQPVVFVANRAYASATRQALLLVPEPPNVVWVEGGVDLASETSLEILMRNSRSRSEAVTRSIDDPYVIMYTSGTSGAPKGGVQSERSFAVGAKTTGLLTDAVAQDVFHLWEPFYHGAAWIVTRLALLKGAKLHMVERFSASRLWDEVREAGITKLHYLGGVINIILAQPPSGDDRDNPVQIAWGGGCPIESWSVFQDRFGLTLREGYGSTEGQMFTHVNLAGVPGSMGRPIEEMESWIADDSGNRLSAGQVGELVLKPTLRTVSMLEYWGEAEKTAELVRDGCIYTGDLASTDEDGNYYYKGRKKDAMRRRGENVSAWEVERILNAAPGVEESVVVGVASELGEQDIAAIVKVRAGSMATPQDLLGYCAERLAYYQVPRYFLFTDEFPRGPSQRILKNEIPVDLTSAWDAEAAGLMPKRQTNGTV